MTVVLAEMMRGGVVESVHEGTIVVVGVGGELVASAGDPETFAFFRSSAKPFQAIPLIESGAADRFGFTPAELALCCASHNGEPRHQEQVLAMLAKLGLDDGALQCGIVLPGDKPEAGRILAGLKAASPLQCDCSGKHTGMLATCLHLGYPIDSYLDPEHPLQRRIREVVGEVCRVDPATMALATDGCSVPTFGASIRAFATAFATLAAPDRAPAGAGMEHAAALNRFRSAMIAHPENVAGTKELVTDLMTFGAGSIVAKSGAEGLLCLGFPERGVGAAIRVADGTFRAHAVIATALLEQLGVVDASVVANVRARHSGEIRNHNGRLVGERRAAFRLSRAA